VRRHWANLAGVRAFLRQKDGANRELGGSDDSYLITAKILDAESPMGLWIEIQWRVQGPELETKCFLIPWNEVLTIVIGKGVEEQSQEIRNRIGF
jgi:hypothetical protein